MGRAAAAEEPIVPHYFNDYLLARCLDQAAGTGWVVRTNPFEGGSDHTPFLDAKKPGVLFWHFTDMYYHTDGDRIDKVSEAELSNVGIAALVSVLTLTSADGQTARELVAEVERAAIKRLDTELALSRAALKQGSSAATEDDILAHVDGLLRSLAAGDGRYRGRRIIAGDAGRDRCRGTARVEGGRRTTRIAQTVT